MRYVHGYNPIKEHGITGKEMLVAALSEKTGKPEKELNKLSKIELRKMWDNIKN